MVLPEDVLYTQAFVLLRIAEPKTRFRTAKHQAAKIEYPDLVQLIQLCFARLDKQQKLWNFSAQTLRKRFDTALRALSLPTSSSSSRPLDLGSFRPGGVTHLLQSTEDSELVRRRGRWASHRVMEIYLQEVAASLYYPQLPHSTCYKVLQFASAFPDLLRRAQTLANLQIPPALGSTSGRTANR